MTDKPLNNSSEEEVLPDIAKTKQNEKPYLKAVLLVLVGVAAILLILKSRHTEPTQKTEVTPIEENYTVQSTAPKQQVTHQKQPVEAPTPPQLSDEQRQMLLALEKEKQARLQAPVMVVGKSQNAIDMQSNKQQIASNDPNTQFMQQASSQPTDTVRPTLMKHLDFMVAKGTIIFGVLETEINSDLPGPIRAIVSEPIYSQDGSRVLIEPGSRLIGQYRSGMQAGQSRVFVAFTDIQKPNGQMLSIGSPGIANLGTVGVGADAIDRHFLERFGTSGLLALIGAGAANVGVNDNANYNASQAYRQAVAQSFAQSANDAYKQNGVIPPTLHIRHGNAVAIFLMQHLDFTSVERQERQRLNIF